MKHDYQGLGVYEQTNRGHDANFGTGYEHIDPSGQSQNYDNYISAGMKKMRRSPMGQMPSMQELQQIMYDTEEQSGLKVISYSHKAQTVAILNKLNFQATSPVGPTIHGVAAYVLASPGQTWIGEFVQNGYMVMIDLSTVTTGAINVIATQDPAAIVQHAGPSGKYVMVDGPPALATAAQQMSASGGGACPSGTAPGADGRCYDIPDGVTDPIINGGTPGQQTPVTQVAATELPSWVIPVAFAAAGVGILAIVIAKKNS